jgi:glycosyltransferase involved in cell wall biosynthesis
VATLAIDARDAYRSGERGSDRYARRLCDALRRRDPDPGIELLFLDRGWPGPELLWEEVVLPVILKRRRAAAVHSLNWPFPLVRPCPGVVTIHDLGFEEYPEDQPPRTRWKARTIAPRAARSAERVICDSEFTRDDVCERYRVGEDKVRVVHLAPGLPHGELPPPPGPYLLTVGDLRPRKNLLRLVEAFRLLRDGGAPHRLVVAGVDWGEGRRIAHAAGDLPVELTGYVSDEELDALMRGADAFVFPSLYEGFGLVVLEAMARGCPAVCARATALPEVGADTAEYFDPLDVDDMAAAVQRVLSDDALRADLAARGRARAASFTWEAAAEGTAAVYRELLG